MKISNSKKQLAEIIHENGGWPSSGLQYAAQGGGVGHVGFSTRKPSREGVEWVTDRGGFSSIFLPTTRITNWHQTILSRDEYFHLHQVVETAPEPVAEVRPAIEQLAADYRNANDYADRKQQEADAAKDDADAKLAELIAAGRAIGLVLSVALSVAPVQKYTGTFYNAELGEAPPYGKNTRDAVCDGCGKRYGEHYGDRCKSGGER